MFSRALTTAFAAFLIAFAVVVPCGAQTDDAIEGQHLISALVEEAQHTFTPGLPRGEKIALLRSMIGKYGDVTLSSEEVLGRYWSKATPEQQKDFPALLVEYAIGSWVDQVGDIPAGERIDFQNSEAKDNGRILIHSISSSPITPPSEVNWTLARNAEGRLAIIDVQASGVSIIKEMNADFTAIIRANGGKIDPLLDTLRQKIETLKSARP